MKHPLAAKLIFVMAELFASGLNVRSADGADWVVFSPGCQQAIVREINGAKETIEYEMYNFTSEPIAKALQDAAKRGVTVTLILDHVASTNKHCQAKPCQAAGCEVLIDRKHDIAHQKIRIVDRRLVMGGSYNDSPKAELKNSENLTGDTDPKTVATFVADFALHKAHAVTLAESQAIDKANKRKRKRKELAK